MIRIAILLFISNSILAQTYFKKGNMFELTSSFGKNEFASSFNWNHLHGVGKKKNLKLGYGLRFTSYLAKHKDFVTAPAKLTSGEEGPQVLFTGYQESNFDTLNFNNANSNYLNIFLVVQYTIFKKLDLGFNIDAIGFSFGSKQNANYFSSKNSPDQYNSVQSASPTPLNLLLVSDNDYGSLNSEFFVRYNFNRNWALKAGASFLFTEYQTENNLRLDNNRFRHKSLLFMIGLCYSPFNS